MSRADTGCFAVRSANERTQGQVMKLLREISETLRWWYRYYHEMAQYAPRHAQPEHAAPYTVHPVSTGHLQERGQLESRVALLTLWTGNGTMPPSAALAWNAGAPAGQDGE